MSYQKQLILWVWALLKLTDIMLFTTGFLYLTVELNLSYTLAVFLNLPTIALQLLLELPSGFIADRIGLRRTVIISFVFLAIAPLPYFSSSNYGLMILGSVFFGIGYAFFSGAFDSYCVEIFRNETKTLFVSRNIIHNTVNIIGPIIAIFFSRSIGYRPFYLVDMVVKLVIIILLVIFAKEVKHKITDQGEFRHFLKIGLKVVKKALNESRPIFYNSIVSLLWGIASGAVDTFFITTLATAHGEGNVVIIIAVMSLLSIISNLSVVKIRDLRTLYWFTFLIHALFVLLVGINYGTGLVGAWLCLRSIAITIYDIAAPVIVNKLIDSDRATLLSWFSFLTTTGKFLAFLVLGSIADHFGIGIIWQGAGLILVLISYFLYRISKEVV